MQKKIQSALISVYNKDGLLPLAQKLTSLNIVIYATGGTLSFLQQHQIACVSVESVTGYPSILGGRVKTLHPKIFGGILARRQEEQDMHELNTYQIPEIDLVVVDLYPFKQTLQQTNIESEIIEKIDVGGPSMIRAAAKNFKSVLVVSNMSQYPTLMNILEQGAGVTDIETRKQFATLAFAETMQYDTEISQYFSSVETKALRYGENPQQAASFVGNYSSLFTILQGKELSYNNLVDVDAAIELISEFDTHTPVVAIIKHTNVCGIAIRNTVYETWETALQCDSESAFGGIIICNQTIDEQTANHIQSIFFEVLIASNFTAEALAILQQKKNRILVQLHQFPKTSHTEKSILQGKLIQQKDEGNYSKFEQVGGREATDAEISDLKFANIICKHLKSNAIAIVKNNQLLGKGCGQTSRIDAVKQAIQKAHQFSFNLEGAVLASDAFFPFSDCVQIAHSHGITAFIQPGGSIRDQETIDYCKQHQLAMVLTGSRHFKH